MIDDVGTIESSEDEESDVKLALPMPTYSAIAAKEAIPDVMEEDQKEAEQVIPVSGPHQTLIVCDDDNMVPEEVDEEGFKAVMSKSQKRSRNSSRISVSDSSGVSKHVESNLSETKVPVKSEISEDWMIDVGTIDSSDDEEELLKHDETSSIQENNSKVLQCDPTNCNEENFILLYDGRASAMGEAQRFSCDDDKLEELDLEQESSESAEQTSWAFVVASGKGDEDIEKQVSEEKEKSQEMPCPPLVIALVDQEDQIADLDKDGYK